MSDEPRTDPAEDEMPVYDRDHLPEDMMVPGGATWGEFTLIEPLTAIEIAGAFQCRLPLEHALRDTVGILTFPEGGFVALDENGDPFGIHSQQFTGLYRPTRAAETVVMHDIKATDGAVVGTIVLDSPLTDEAIWDLAVTPVVGVGFDTERGVDTVKLEGWLAAPRTTIDTRHREPEPPYAYIDPPEEPLSDERIARSVEERFGSWLTRDDISALRAFVLDPNDAARSQINALGVLDKLTAIAGKP
jgi:hypothetical protein